NPLAHEASHLVIEDVRPQVDGGRFPAKRIEGDWLEVSADIFRDGHDLLAAALAVRQPGSTTWQTAPMRLVSNDRWSARLRLESIGRAEYFVEAWTDHFATWRDEVIKKRAARQAFGLELQEGRALIEAALSRVADDEALAADLQMRLEEDARLGTDENARANL